jgi:hypothetical protein
MSTLTEQPQPDRFRYNESFLELLPRISRASTPNDPTGVPWPEGDPTWPIQPWYADNPVQDPALGPDMASYWIFNGNPANPGLVKTPVPFARARVPNLPGGVFIPYVPKPTPALFAGGGPVNVDRLSTIAEAMMLSRLIKGATIKLDPEPLILNGEAREMWQIWTSALQGQAAYYVGQLVIQEKSGPGLWDSVGLATGKYLWDSTAPAGPLQPFAPTLDVPCRRLKANEGWYIRIEGPLGAAMAEIERNDIPDPNPPAGGAGGLTPTEDQRLTHIEAILVRTFGG